MNRTILATALVAIALAGPGCATSSMTTGSVSSNEYQIAGHPYKSAVGCTRKAPVGKFDAKCDIPVLGWRGANGLDLPSVGGGAPGGFQF